MTMQLCYRCTRTTCNLGCDLATHLSATRSSTDLDVACVLLTELVMGDNGRSNPDEGTLQITPCVAVHLDNWTAQKH